MRSSAKAVNFGIVYGISDYTLARNISVTRAEARDFMDRYFARYPGVKRFMDEAVRLGHERGYARTLLGRRRYLPELKSGNYNVRAFGERCAMNSPIQGTAADIIKLAMIRVFRGAARAGAARPPDPAGTRRTDRRSPRGRGRARARPASGMHGGGHAPERAAQDGYFRGEELA